MQPPRSPRAAREAANPGPNSLPPDASFRLLVESVSDFAIVMLDPDGRVTTWNAGAERIAGYAADEIVGRHVSMFYPPDERDGGRPARELDAAAAADRFECQGWRVRKDGSRFWAHVILTPLRGAGGGLVGFANVTEDLTARQQVEDALRRSEARLSGIIASAMDAIVSVNEDQRIVVFNSAAERIFGCSAIDALGTPIHRFLPERFRADHARHIRAYGQTGVTTRSMGALRPLMALRADGTEFPIEATISQVEASGQRLFTVILRDVTERKRAEAERDLLLRDTEAHAEQLRQQAAELEQANSELARLAAAAQAANKAKAEFLAMMSHELRTPLNAIAGYVQLLEMGLRGPVTPEQAVDLQRIQRSQRHLLTLINNLLNFARIEAGQLAYTVANVCLAEVLSDIAELLQPQGREKALILEFGPVDRGLAARADADKVRQVLLNLLSNAMKFTPAGGRVGVTVEPSGSDVRLRVWDTGCGIPAEQLGTIFEPFVQLERSLAKPTEGVGLGLAISRDLARGMGGELRVESVPGAGSTFTLVLPRAA